MLQVAVPSSRVLESSSVGLYIRYYHLNLSSRLTAASRGPFAGPPSPEDAKVHPVVACSKENKLMDPCAGRESTENVDSMEMKYAFLKRVTHDFSKERIIGSGTFGVVYEGALENGEKVAVKVLRDGAALDDKAFRNEFQNVARIEHKNIVKFLGYCNDPEELIVDHDGTKVRAEKMHKALCFEYVDNGSLHEYISDENQGLEWHIRFKIILGICEGLKHLRVGLEKPLWHLDLKPENILLDRKMTPKIADFGIARLIIGDENTRKTISPVGTCGYWPPEFVRFQFLSEAFDIFSLGVIIAKIMIGTKGYNDCATMQPRKLIKHVHNNWKKKLQETLKPRSVEQYCQQVKACIEIASKCLAEDRKDRPRIQDIADILNETETIIPRQIEQEVSGERSRSSYKRNSLNHIVAGPLTLSSLKAMTDNFSDRREIGRGSMGVVYKGGLEDQQVIAVVKLIRAYYSEKKFKDMIRTLMTTNHENIIKFLGYCYETVNELVEYRGKFVFAERTIQAFSLEYMQNGSLEGHISDEYLGHDWCTRYKIIKGTCDGLWYLHEQNTLHMNLKASNILLDENMVPKLADFGWSRPTEEPEVDWNIGNFHMRYLPPEFVAKQVISVKYDIYSLGIIILEIISGTTIFAIWKIKKPRELIDLVVAKWRERLEETLNSRSVEGYCQQVKKCIEIALMCLEEDRFQRPEIGDIIRMLDETEALLRLDSDLLDVYPTELCFPFRPKKHVSCLLQLLNKDDDRVAFRIQSNSPKRYLTKLPLCSVVPPRCTYTIALTSSRQQQSPPSDSDEGFLLQSMIVSDNQEHRLTNLDQALAVKEYDNLFTKAQETTDNDVQKRTLKAIYAPSAGAASSKLTQQEIEITATLNSRQVKSIEVHPKEPWVMTTHHAGNLRIWNYKTMEVLNLFEVPDEPVYVAKFLERDEWVVAGDGNGHIHVYSYDGNEEATSFEAHNSRIMSLAVHPTESYVLSSSHDDHLIKLWHWDPYWDFDKGCWECKAIFKGHSDKVSHILFNPKDTGTFASASWDGSVKIWDLKSNACNTTITSDKLPDPVPVLCVDYVTEADRQYLITGSKDGTQVWNMETKKTSYRFT
ncbi:hypothetical protein QOZ80_5AG0385890 [Eleusine coracana subsp. coracana]|nr:hypothetical protein QOZ80_5AG0385890 [Eleusine coracana subsp. coracana]